LRSAIGSLLGKVKSSVRIIHDITVPYRTSSVCGDGIDKPNAATTISVLENKKLMDQNQLKWIAGFVWNIADDRLRDVYVRGKLKSASFPRRRESSSDETGPPNLDTRIRGYDDALYGRFIVDGELLEYESDTEQVPLKEDGGIEAFFRREVLPTLPMPGSRWMPPRSATKSRLPATSTGPRR